MTNAIRFSIGLDQPSYQKPKTKNQILGGLSRSGEVDRGSVSRIEAARDSFPRASKRHL